MKKISDNILVSNYSIFEEYLKRNWKWILINTVNCEWFMWKWIALEFKIRFWEQYFLDYEEKCKHNKIKIWEIDYNEKFKIINFPTKWAYKFPSKKEWIILWLKDFCIKIESWIFDNEIIYIPKLWSSHWWLNWEEIYLILKENLINLKNNKVKFIICEDNEAGEIEKNILENLKNYNWVKLNDKIKTNIKKNFYKIKRLRNLFEIDWIWEKSYKNILDLENDNQTTLF